LERLADSGGGGGTSYKSLPAMLLIKEIHVAYVLFFFLSFILLHISFLLGSVPVNNDWRTSSGTCTTVGETVGLNYCCDCRSSPFVYASQHLIQYDQ
jgi:hypothetical protein